MAASPGCNVCPADISIALALSFASCREAVTCVRFLSTKAILHPVEWHLNIRPYVYPLIPSRYGPVMSADILHTGLLCDDELADGGFAGMCALLAFATWHI